MTDRQILLIAHTGRDQAIAATARVAGSLREHGLRVRILKSDAQAIGSLEGVEVVDDVEAADNCDLAIVLGGDGTILRAAELTRPASTPILGVNLGHVGFLAEAETEDLDTIAEAVAARRYTIDERLTLDVNVFHDGELVDQTWALNEAAVEKASRERMLQVVLEIDGRPLSRWGCDGVVCATPTGSTAYNFSAGGPIVWPEVDALLVVPISAHALFARPMVVSPDSRMAVEVLAGSDGSGVLWCDGRRTVDLPPGARIEVQRGAQPVGLVRLHDAPFADRLVAKFELPVDGWRGRSGGRT